MGRAFEYRKAAKMKRWGHMAKTFTRLGKQRLFAGDQVAYFRDQVKNPGIGDTHPMQTIKVAFTQEKDGEPITIGVATDGAPSATWFKIDNFRLFREQ